MRMARGMPVIVRAEVWRGPPDAPGLARREEARAVSRTLELGPNPELKGHFASANPGLYGDSTASIACGFPVLHDHEKRQMDQLGGAHGLG